MGKEGLAYSVHRCRPLLTLAASLLLTCGPGKDWTGETAGGEETRCSGFYKSIREVVTSSRNHRYWLRSLPQAQGLQFQYTSHRTEWQVRVNSSEGVYWLSRKTIGPQRESGAVILSSVAVHEVQGASGLLDMQLNWCIRGSKHWYIPFSYPQNFFSIEPVLDMLQVEERC